MKGAPLRSLLFNIAFYAVTALCCVMFLPLLGLERLKYLQVVRLWLRIVYALERHILGLRWEVRGRENLPPGGRFIVAAKHQSAYETMKIHLLFEDPAIVLKQELLDIPLWGRYLGKSGVIAIDRAARGGALRTAEGAAIEARDQGRPLIIFPQGTRVRPQETPQDKPYKPGVYRLQFATGLPIVPMALNAGLFWPRKGWRKSPGTVVFEFLPPIEPGLPRGDVMQKLETVLEDATNRLMDEARRKDQA